MRAIAVCFVALCALSAVQGGRILCYYASWAIYRQGDGQFQPENMDVQHCTHIVYGFAGLDASTNQIMSLDTWADLESGLNGYKRFTALTAQNPNVVPMLSVGGWNEGSTKYSTMVSTDAGRTAFINSAVSFLGTYGFKGLDIDWEYPTQRGGVPEDKQNFALLLQGLKSAFSGPGYILTIATSVNHAVVDSGYDVPTITQTVDFINLLSYDFYTYLDGYTAHGEPLNSRSDEDPTFCLTSAISYWVQVGYPADRINFGLAAYGHTFTLSDQANNGPHSASSGGGNAGPYTGAIGSLGYNEICLNNWGSIVEPSWQAPYAFSGNQWVSYDDVTSIQAKCSYAKSLGIGGASVYSIDTDDFRGKCGAGVFPLLAAIASYC